MCSPSAYHHSRRRCNGQKALAAFGELVLPVPDPMSNDAEGRRFTHLDLSDLSLAELRREEGRTRLRLLLDDAAPA